MNQTNQLRGEAKHYNLWFEAKTINKLGHLVKDCVLTGFNEGKNYNTMKHCKLKIVLIEILYFTFIAKYLHAI